MNPAYGVVSFSIPEALKSRMERVFGAGKVNEVAEKALRKALGDAELQQFAADKRAEIEAQAKKLNEELLGG
jgi:hypothetical protein